MQGKKNLKLFSFCVLLQLKEKCFFEQVPPGVRLQEVI